ncbi:MAG: nucleoside hydrolase [Chloroflexi bacterium]|nr:nucleoside hydrolase [Chloroflexota bacterium]
MTKNLSENRKIPMILDTDMSPDSWAALLFLAKHPMVDLLAVSISGTGESHGEIGARNAARLMALLDPPRSIPIGFGSPTPLMGNKHFPKLMRFAMDQMLFLGLSKLDAYPNFENSVEMISKILATRSTPVRIAAVGPQTNIASVILQRPNLIKKIENITIMGGAVDVPGNIHDVGFWIKNEVAEWNFFCDPLAVRTVFESGIPVRLVSLDTTNQVPVSKSFVESLEKQAKSPDARFILKMLKLITGNFRREMGFYLWDPMTSATAIDPSLCQFEEMRLDIITDSGEKWAGIVKKNTGSRVQVAKKINKDEFEKTLLSVLCF